MAKKKTQLYPGIAAAERERGKRKNVSWMDDQPDILCTANGYCPNYEKFSGWTTEKALVWCNID